MLYVKLLDIITTAFGWLDSRPLYGKYLFVAAGVIAAVIYLFSAGVAKAKTMSILFARMPFLHQCNAFDRYFCIC